MTPLPSRLMMSETAQNTQAEGQQYQKQQLLLSLCRAARAGGLQEASDALSQGADVNGVCRLKGEGDGRGKVTPLIVATKYCNASIVRLLLDAGADPEKRAKADGEAAVHAAASGGVWREARGLGDILLLFKRQVGGARNISTLRELVHAGADVEATMSGGQSPLHVAAASDNAEAIEVLIAAGARVDVRCPPGSPDGRTPLCVAAMYGKVRAVRILLDKNARAEEPLLEAERVSRWPGGGEITRRVLPLLRKRTAQANHGCEGE